MLVTNFNNQNSKVIYSKIIPTNNELNIKNEKSGKKTEQLGSIKTVKTNLEVQNDNMNTQRGVINANKSNKWRIQIPKIGLDVHIKEGTSLDILLRAVGHFSETSNWDGNVGFAAHNRGFQCNFFEKLKIGDEIIYRTTQGKRVYKVQINKVILETDWSYLEETKDNRITLITCEENRGEYRRCLQAVQVAEYLE